MDTQSQSQLTVAPPATIHTGGTTLPDGVTPALNTAQASIFTGLAVATLEGLRCRGNGPRFVRYGRKAVRYRVCDLNAWMPAQTRQSPKSPPVKIIPQPNR